MASCCANETETTQKNQLFYHIKFHFTTILSNQKDSQTITNLTTSPHSENYLHVFQEFRICLARKRLDSVQNISEVDYAPFCKLPFHWLTLILCTNERSRYNFITARTCLGILIWTLTPPHHVRLFTFVLPWPKKMVNSFKSFYNLPTNQIWQRSRKGDSTVDGVVQPSPSLLQNYLTTVQTTVDYRPVVSTG